MSLVACSARPFPPLPAETGPLREELIALATAGDRLLVLERRGPRLTLVVFDRRTQRREVVDGLPAWDRDAMLARLPDTAAAEEHLRATDLGRRLEQGGFAWVQPVGEPRWTTTFGAVVRRDAWLVITDGEAEARLARFTADLEPDEERWVRSADGDQLIVEVLYENDGMAARDLRVVDVRAADAQLMSARAYAAHERHSYDLSTAMWRQALELAPDRADLAYNVACGEARRGNGREALEFLRRAISREPQRYRLLARYDRDLFSLRDHPIFQALTATLPAGSAVD